MLTTRTGRLSPVQVSALSSLLGADDNVHLKAALRLATPTAAHAYADLREVIKVAEPLVRARDPVERPTFGDVRALYWNARDELVRNPNNHLTEPLIRQLDGITANAAIHFVGHASHA